MTHADEALLAEAAALDAADPLADRLDAFLDAPGVVAYLDGNSLGRPLRDVPDRLDELVRREWGTRLIRSWDERWMAMPERLGDLIAEVALGAGPGQTVVGDSTSVMLYKLVRAAMAARPGRDEILVEEGNFPTDRFVAAGIARELGAVLRWISPDPVEGVRPADVAAAVSDRTAVALLSHVDYRSGALADMREVTAAVHRGGALMLWDLCHSVGAVPLELAACGVDLAVGCTYKYLNGGPGSPAFAYVRSGLQDALHPPINGWWGAADVFAMGSEYVPAAGVRRLLSGTPSIVSMLPMQSMLRLIAGAGMTAVRAKSVSLTEFAIRAHDAVLAPRGARLLSPRDPSRRGGHITIGHPDARAATGRLWAEGVVPDFRFPDGIRLGLSPLSTSHAETLRGILAVREALGPATG